MARTLQELEKLTQAALDEITAAHKKLEVIAAERDEVAAEDAAKAKAEAKGNGTTVKVPAGVYKARGA